MKGLFADKKQKILFALVFALLILPAAIESQAQDFGWWRGLIEQPVAGKPPVRYPAEMTLYGDRGKISYPTYGCEGELTLEKKTDYSFTYREHITRGGTCIDQGLITVKEADIGKVQYTWQGQGITASGYFYGPMELEVLQLWLNLNSESYKVDEFLRTVPLADVNQLLSYVSKRKDGTTPTLVAYTYALSSLRVQGKELLCLPMIPVDKSKGMSISVSNYELSESIAFGGVVDRLNDVFCRVAMSPEALADSKRQHPDWEAFRLYAKVALQAMLPSSYDEGLKWVNANLGKKKATATIKGCEAVLELKPIDPAFKKMHPTVKYVMFLTLINKK